MYFNGNGNRRSDIKKRFRAAIFKGKGPEKNAGFIN